MEINVIEEKKDKIVFEVNEGVGFLNAVKAEMWNDKDVKAATIFVKHPLVGRPRMTVEGDDPRKAIASACQRLKKANEKLAAEVKKEIK
ncbi:hypothetical protein HYU13_04855 [Candidatus Woesearchaeota archaeon]|nr:hypothetical protein [Candidatus Woesearchaeota archaeon]